MKRLHIAFLYAIILALMSGCSGYFNNIDKNKVMVKTISKEQTKEEVSYGDLLSLETVNTLSVNAVNKYFDKKLKEEDVQIDLKVVDQEDLRHLFVRLEYGVAPRPEGNKSIDLEAKLKEVPSGLFYVNLGVITDSTIQYNLVINARDGNVLQVKQQINPQVVQEKQHTRVEAYNRESIKMDKVIDSAERFVKEKAGLTSISPQSGEDSMRWRDTVVELFFKDEHNESFIYSVLVDMNTNTVMGFNKGLLVMLSLFS